MNRRNFLKLVGGGIVVAAGGATGFALTRTPTTALAPWGLAGDARYDDPRLSALSYAILAPNPHNRQPWTVALEGEDTVVLGIDPDPLLPHTDPFSRQITIGLGCFLELMRMAAAETGHRVETELFPDGEDATALDPSRPVAIARFVKDASIARDPLFAHVLERRSNKEPFDVTRDVSPASLAAIVGAGREGFQIGGTVDAQEVAAWRELTERALMIEIETPHTFKESVDLFRIGKAEVNANPDGIDFSGPLYEGLALAGLFSRASTLDTTSASYQQGITAVVENTRTAMGHVWMVTPGNSRAEQIRAGADWLRINLAATKEGLGFQPLSQALQEYPEMAEIYAQTHAQLVPEGGTVQMLARIGYGQKIAVSPRWPIEAKLKG